MTAIDAAPAETGAWLEQTWDPEMTVGQWWQQLADARLSNPMLPEPWGRGWGRAEAAAFASEVVRRGALGPPAGIGMMLAVPTILAHGTDDVIQRLVSFPNVILTGHQAFFTVEAIGQIMATTIESLTAFEQGKPLQHRIPAS